MPSGSTTPTYLEVVLAVINAVQTIWLAYLVQDRRRERAAPSTLPESTSD